MLRRITCVSTPNAEITNAIKDRSDYRTES
jgi:hypothetical protein